MMICPKFGWDLRCDVMLVLYLAFLFEMGDYTMMAAMDSESCACESCGGHTLHTPHYTTGWYRVVYIRYVTYSKVL